MICNKDNIQQCEWSHYTSVKRSWRVSQQFFSAWINHMNECDAQMSVAHE